MNDKYPGDKRSEGRRLTDGFLIAQSAEDGPLYEDEGVIWDNEDYSGRLTYSPLVFTEYSESDRSLIEITKFDAILKRR